MGAGRAAHGARWGVGVSAEHSAWWGSAEWGQGLGFVWGGGVPERRSPSTYPALGKNVVCVCVCVCACVCVCVCEREREVWELWLNVSG